ncbi:response regulator transcription factor [Bordetella genomosp. 11]|uniref:Helix-turn-helix transcriptional regulator n=1 Tax=Bordetella genomosp. 11 TaxID=1416808 RepID=A0A261UED3_9BORD|nr:response regulator transcription factor [Bordetella genomosp. 11]OZI59590.1 helix-turn-helix transcriptional regulator [Bordetella genomosp. 11]
MSKMVLIEAHPLLRLGLRQILGKVEGVWEIVGLDLANLDEAAEQNRGAELLIFGLPIETETGWQALADVRRVLAPKRILLLVDNMPMQALSRLPEGSIHGCLMKTASIEVLEAAIRLVMAGGQCFPSGQMAQPSATADAPAAATVQHAPANTSMMMAGDGDHAASQKMAMPITAGAQLLKITPRQYEVLVLLSRGYPIKTVSRMLNISVATAKTHACTLYQRLQVKNKGEAVYTALQRGATLDWDSSGANGSSYERNRL